MQAICEDDAECATDYQFNPNATQFVQVSARYWMVSDGVSGYQLLKQADERDVDLHEVELHYVLELDNFDEILGGEWTKAPGTSWGEDSKQLHPDFLWMAIDAKGWGENPDDTGGNIDRGHAFTFTVMVRSGLSS